MADDRLFCPECGTPNESDAAFCESCGHALGEAQPDAAITDEEASPPAPRRRFSPKILALLALLVAGVAGATVFRAPITSFIDSKKSQPALAGDSLELAPAIAEAQLSDTAGPGHASDLVQLQLPEGAEFQISPPTRAMITRPQPPSPRPQNREAASVTPPNLPDGVVPFPDDFKAPAAEPVTRMPVTGGNADAATGTATTTRESAPARSPARIPAGAAISLRSSDQVCTDKSREGAKFRGVVQQDVIGSNGGTIPRGTVITFVVDRLKRAGANEKPEFSIAPESMELEGERYPLTATVDAVTIRPKKVGLMGALVGAAAVAAATRAAGGDAKQTVAGGVAGGAAGAVIGNQLKTGDGCIERNGTIRITLREDVTVGSM